MFALMYVVDKIPGKKNPFQPGEKLMYKGKWGIIPAEEIILEVLPHQTINGIETFHFVMITKTSPVVDRIYKIREQRP